MRFIIGLMFWTSLVVTLSGLLPHSSYSKVVGACKSNKDSSLVTERCGNEIHVAKPDDNNAAKGAYLATIEPSTFVGDVDGNKCERCICISYLGPLLAGCGGQCRSQSYTMVLAPSGEVKGFLSQSLQRYSAFTESEHAPLSADEIERIVEISNSNELLKMFYGHGFGKNPLDEYATRMSNPEEVDHKFKTYKFEDAGNTLATFLLHLSRVRTVCKMQKADKEDWPLYLGPTPAPPEDESGMPKPHLPKDAAPTQDSDKTKSGVPE